MHPFSLFINYNLKIDIDIPNEVVGIRLEEMIEGRVDFKNDVIEVEKQNEIIYKESIETSCWSCFIAYITCVRWCKNQKIDLYRTYI